MRRGPRRSDGGTPLSPLERVAFNWGLQAAVVPSARAAQPATLEPEEAAAGGPATAVRERRDWAYFGMLAFTAILFFRPQDIFPPLESLHLAELSALLGIGAMISGRMARKEPVLPMTPEVTGVLLLSGIMAALVPFSVWPGGSMTLMTGVYLKVVLIFVLMAGTLTTPARLERFAWLIVLASAYLGLHAAIDYAHGIHMVEDDRVRGSVGGVFDNPNDLALNTVAFLPIALLFAVRRDRSAGRLVAGIAAVLMFVTIVFTKSRGGFLGLVAMLLVMLVQGGRVRRGLGVGIVVASLAAVPLLPASFWERMASITNASEDPTGSREARRTVMKEAWQAFLERPLTGVGPGEFVDYNPPWRQQRFREAHDAWLQVASETGIVGAAVFIWLVVMACRNAFRSSRSLARLRLRRRPARAPAPRTVSGRVGDAEWQTVNLFATAMTGAVVGWIVCATFASVAYNWTFYYVFGITMATRQIATQMATRARPGPRLERTARA